MLNIFSAAAIISTVISPSAGAGVGKSVAVGVGVGVAVAVAVAVGDGVAVGLAVAVGGAVAVGKNGVDVGVGVAVAVGEQAGETVDETPRAARSFRKLLRLSMMRPPLYMVMSCDATAIVSHAGRPHINRSVDFNSNKKTAPRAVFLRQKAERRL
jgi:hypothetical protein